MDATDQWAGYAITRLEESNETEVAGLLLRLDQRSRISRFGSATNDAQLIAYASRALASAAWLGGAVIDARLQAIAEVYRLASWGQDSAEVAFVVDPGYRGRGIAAALLKASVHWANAAGISTLRMVFPCSNRAMRKLASKAVVRHDKVLDEMIVSEMSVHGGVTEVPGELRQFRPSPRRKHMLGIFGPQLIRDECDKGAA